MAATTVLSACGPAEPDPPSTPTVGDPSAPLPHRGPFSFDARVEVTESLREDMEAPRHPSDGAGRAWIEAAFDVDAQGARPARTSAAGRPLVRAGSLARFEVIFEAGPLGVAEDGAVFLQTSPFWDWSEPHVFADAPGYTRVSTEAEGVELEAVPVVAGLLAISVRGRALAAGERIRIEYGAGPLGARVDTYAERGTRLWVAVDGDGDGVRALIDDPPRIDIEPREPAILVATLPSTAEPGDAVRLTLALVDGVGNAGIRFEGAVALETPPGLELPPMVAFEAQHRGTRTVEGRATAPGVFRVLARTGTDGGPLEAESNPLTVREGIQPTLWGDLHGHSHLSDGTGTPEDFYDYARNVAGLDVAALTDHDHWGMRFLDASPGNWERIREAARDAYEPGRFVTLLGYEWTSWLQGHRHVLYFRDVGEVLSSMDRRYETPDQLWDALRGLDALTFAHHSAGGPVSVNWSFAPPPDLEPVTEIASVHGSSEARDSPASIYNPVPGNFVRDVLRVGYRFGFIGSGDSHDGHPGLSGIAANGTSGLAAIHAHEHTREAVLEALRARRTYATNGPRIHLEVSLESATDGPGQRLRLTLAGTAPFERVDFIRSGLVATVAVDGQRELSLEREIPALGRGEFLYVRAVQEDRGTAWSSPFYGADPEAAEAGGSEAGASD